MVVILHAVSCGLLLALCRRHLIGVGQAWRRGVDIQLAGVKYIDVTTGQHADHGADQSQHRIVFCGFNAVLNGACLARLRRLRVFGDLYGRRRLATNSPPTVLEIWATVSGPNAQRLANLVML